MKKEIFRQFHRRNEGNRQKIERIFERSASFTTYKVIFGGEMRDFLRFSPPLSRFRGARVVETKVTRCAMVALPHANAASDLPQDAQAVGNDVQVGFFAGIARGYREFGDAPPAGVGDGDYFQVNIEARAEFRELKRLQETRIVDNETAVAVRKLLPEGDVLERSEKCTAESLVEGHVARSRATCDGMAGTLNEG